MSETLAKWKANALIISSTITPGAADSAPVAAPSVIARLDPVYFELRLKFYATLGFHKPQDRTAPSTRLCSERFVVEDRPSFT